MKLNCLACYKTSKVFLRNERNDHLKEQEENGRIILQWMVGKCIILIGDGRNPYRYVRSLFNDDISVSILYSDDDTMISE